MCWHRARNTEPKLNFIKCPQKASGCPVVQGDHGVNPSMTHKTHISALVHTRGWTMLSYKKKSSGGLIWSLCTFWCFTTTELFSLLSCPLSPLAPCDNLCPLLYVILRFYRRYHKIQQLITADISTCCLIRVSHCNQLKQPIRGFISDIGFFSTQRLSKLTSVQMQTEQKLNFYCVKLSSVVLLSAKPCVFFPRTSGFALIRLKRTV